MNGWASRPERLYVTVYTDDDEAFNVWRDVVGVPETRISRWGEDENFWPANAVSQGPDGPCGPCSEIFYDRGVDFGSDDETGPNTGSGDRFIEIWNLVFTQFDRQEGGQLVPLPQQNIDTGLGFERLAAVMTGKPDAYATELFQPTICKIVELTGQPYEGPKKPVPPRRRRARPRGDVYDCRRGAARQRRRGLRGQNAHPPRRAPRLAVGFA